MLFRSIIFVLASTLCAHAQTPLEKRSAFLLKEYTPNCSSSLYMQHIHKAEQEEDWNGVIRHSIAHDMYAPSSKFSSQISYCLGNAYMKLQEYGLANTAFNTHLLTIRKSPHLEKILEHKLVIAEKFSKGEKRRINNGRYMPKIVNSTDEACNIYQEVFERAALSKKGEQALLSKAHLQYRFKKYDECIDTSRLIILRFPHSENVPEAHLLIANGYKELAKMNDPSFDTLARSSDNHAKFMMKFSAHPVAEKISDAHFCVKKTKAQKLYECAQYYEWKGKKEAACMYYTKVKESLPNTPLGDDATKKVEMLKK